MILTNAHSFLKNLVLQMENISLYYIQKNTVQNFITIRDFITSFYRHQAIKTINLRISFFYYKQNIDVRCEGRISDRGVYNKSELKEAVLNYEFNFPPPKTLSGIDENDIFWDKNHFTPFLFVADDAFPLSQNVMKPYPRKTLITRSPYLGTYYLTFFDLEKTHFEFWLVGLSSF